MADYSQGGPPPPPPMLHAGRIPSFKNNHGENFQNRCGAEPPPCVQNAMLTKDKKPFTYTPGGLDLSQIKTPSMARRLNKQQQLMDDQANPAYQQRSNMNGAVPPPPPPMAPPAPPPPPPLVINVSKSPKTVQDGERPEIVIPENPIGMLRKTHSPYHWESEEAERLRQGAVPKFVDKPKTNTPQMRMPPPKQFSQQPPQQQNKSPSTSPIWKPEPKYPASPTPPPNYAQQTSPPIYAQQTPSPTYAQTPPPQSQNTLQRQDSKFNHSPSPWNREPPLSNSSSRQTFTPSVDTQSSNKSSTPISSPMSPQWRQETIESPTRMSPFQIVNQRNSPRVEPPSARGPMSPPIQEVRMQSPYVEQQSAPIYNNVNRQVQSPEAVQKQNTAPWRQTRPEPQATESPEVRYQTHMTIPVTPRKQKSEEASEPFSPKVLETPKATLPWVRDENAINKSAPPPPWCVKAQETRKSLPRDSFEEQETSPVQPPWYQQQQSKTLPRSHSIQQNNTMNRQTSQQNQERVIPVTMDVSRNDISASNNMRPNQGKQPQLRIIIDMNQQGKQPEGEQYQVPQQRITRVMQPQMVRMDNGGNSGVTQGQQPKTRIIPIQMEPPSPDVTSPRVLNRSISNGGGPRQSMAFRVLQTITGTVENDLIDDMETNHGYSDL